MDLKALAAELHNSAILDRPKNDDVETKYCFWKYGHLTSKGASASCGSGSSSFSCDIASARKKIQDALDNTTGSSHVSVAGGGDSTAIGKRVDVLERENKDMRQEITELKHLVEKLQVTIESLTKGGPQAAKPAEPKLAVCPAKPAVCPAKTVAKTEDDDEIDLFGSDEDEEESEEKAKVREARLKAYEEKKTKKPGPIAKSSVILDVKPWDDETNMADMEKLVRGIEKDGLVWGASKLVPVGYGIKKLQIMCVVEDDKVSIEELQEQIQEFEDCVQSVDIAAFNKI